MTAETPHELPPLLRAEGLTKCYPRQRWMSRGRRPAPALDDVSFAVATGTTLAVVGESGSGKSTLARCLALLERPDSGSIWYGGRDLLAGRGPPAARRSVASLRREIQLVFQDPASALSPRFSAVEIVAEPLRIERRLPRSDHRRLALRAMAEVGLLRRWADRLPAELSGGQRQRLAIARALVARPRLLILDEVLAALDLSIQARIVNLLLELQSLHSLTYLFISHDLPMVGHVADEIVVLRRGKVVEQGPAAAVLNDPQHPHTRALLAAAPRLKA